MQLLVITPPALVPNEARLASELLAAGLPRLHVRKPAFGPAEMRDYVHHIPARYHARLVLHGHPTLVAELNLGGLHLTAAARNCLSSRPQLRPGQTLSTAFHTLAEIRQHRRKYAYVFLSPVFDSISKTGYVANPELSTLHEILRQRQQRGGYMPHVLALGGITADKLALVRQAGFAGAAVLGAIWQSPDPVAAFRELQVTAAGL